MKKNYLLTFLVATLISISTLALEGDSFDNSDSERTPKVLSVESLGWQLQVQGEITAFSLDGTRLLYKNNENAEWNFNGSKNGMHNVWTFKQAGLPDLYLAHEWQLSETGVLSVKLTQYESMKRQGTNSYQPGKVIREASHIIKDMMPITWEYFRDRDKKVVVRFSPHVWPEELPEDLGTAAINGRNMVIYDGKGRVWAKRLKNTNEVNNFFGVETYLGSLFISSQPFPGAKEIGEVKRGLIQIQGADGARIFIQSETSFVAEGVKGKIYGFVDYNRKTENRSRVRSYGTGTVHSFLKRISGE